VRLSSDPAARRRLAVLGALALLAFGAGLFVAAQTRTRLVVSGPETPVPPRAEPAPESRKAAERLDLERQIGQLVVLRFNGTGPPAYVPRALRAGRAAGVILFAENISSREALPALVRRVQRGARGSALVSTDQEGGAIRNLKWAAPLRSQSATPTPAAAGVGVADCERSGAAHFRLRMAPPSWSVETSADPRAPRWTRRTSAGSASRELMFSANRITPAARPARSARGT